MKKAFLIFSGLLFLLGCILIYQNITYNDKKLHVVICDVGQGDAIFIRTPNGSDILIDSGPDEKVLSCLSKHMPFWDRTIEIAILTHPDADHITGFIDVIKRYKLIRFYTSNITAKTAVYVQFLKTLADYKIKQNYLWQGDRFVLKDGLTFQTLWPTLEWQGTTTNSFSVIELLTYKNFKALFTGDS
ncbi:MAG: MBL fold metallo-hydrolase, partial [bacterium]|nr:MBL fold metallo-hydrolase [bacterium]